MNIKKQLITLGAAVAATVAMVSPASATIYTYTRTDGIKVVIDNVAKTGSIKGSAPGLNADIRSVDLNFSGAGLASFNGAPTLFTTTLSSLTGDLIDQSGIVFEPSGGAGTLSLTINPTTGIINLTKNGDSWSDVRGAYTSMLLGRLTSVVDPVAVPEPAMLGLFGAGAVMVMMGRRRRSVAKSVAGTGKLALAC